MATTLSFGCNHFYPSSLLESQGSPINQSKGSIGIRGRIDGVFKMVSMRYLGIVRKWG